MDKVALEIEIENIRGYANKDFMLYSYYTMKRNPPLKIPKGDFINIKDYYTSSPNKVAEVLPVILTLTISPI